MDWMIVAIGSGPRSSLSHFAAVACLLFLAFPAFARDAEESASPNPVVSQTQTQSSTTPQNDPSDQSKQTEKEPEKTKNDRMFYVMPNFLTVGNQSKVAPLSWKQKFAITAKGSFDPYEFVVVGVLAGTRQAENAYPAFGQGFVGYAKRYGTAFADQVDGNIMVGGLYPTILKTDPRYFQLGKGKFIYRFGYALSRIFITRRDSGGRLFNFPEFAGNATAIAISNVYYPSADRGFSAGVNNWGVQMGIDAFGNELKEFWPDIHRRLSKKKNSPPSR